MIIDYINYNKMRNIVYIVVYLLGTGMAHGAGVDAATLYHLEIISDKFYGSAIFLGVRRRA